jgi:MbtH protein
VSDEASEAYRVVTNHEEQYSIWPAEKENAPGWRDAGFKGSKADALAYINEHWTDMRPLSLRQQMAQADQPAAASAPVAVAAPPTLEAPAVASTPATPSAPAEPVAAPVAVASTPTTDEAEPAKQKRGWFGRQHNEQPAPVTTEEPAEKQKRGWFGRR